MNKNSLRTAILVTILILAMASSMEPSLTVSMANESELVLSQDHEASYTFDLFYDHFRSEHNLHVSVPNSLYQYYERKSHSVAGNSDYAKFATPEAFSIVAESIKKATNEAPNSDEQFANAVLSLVRQIPYSKSKTKYPVEALVENSGDCDVLSLLAVSIMKAGGLDVVLLYYKDMNPTHMNVGVYLPYKPIYRSWWLAPTGFEYDNKTYWMAECTSKGEWKVGDEPVLLDNVKPQVVTLKGAEKRSPAKISSSLDSRLMHSAISATVSPDNSSLEGEARSLVITGEASPALPGKNVTMYVCRDKLAFETYRTVTDENGKYFFSWNFTFSGKYSITTSLGGTTDYAGSDSENLIVYAGVYEPILGEQDADSGLSTPFGSIINQSPKYVLKSNVSGTGLSLSGEFMVISENDTGSPTIELRVPKVERIVYFPKTRQAIRVIIREEQVINVPVENDQLGFILRYDGEENYGATVGVLGEQQISQITGTLAEMTATFMNVSDFAARNKWYRVEATISQNATNAKLYEINNTLLQNVAAPRTFGNGEMGILMSYPPNSILAFKNLEISNLGEESSTLPFKEEQNRSNEIPQLAPFIAGAIILATGCVVAAGYARRRKTGQTKHSRSQSE